MFKYDDFERYRIPTTIAVNKISKMIPKSPIKVSDNLHSCPKCGVGVFLNIKKCNWCGQLLDWSIYEK